MTGRRFGRVLVERSLRSADEAPRLGETRDVRPGRLARAAVAYRQRAVDDTDGKVIDVVGSTGQVTGRLVRSILDVHPSTASTMLADLVARGVLVKTSEATRKVHPSTSDKDDA